MGIVKLTKSSSIDPQDTGLKPVVNPPYWASEVAVSINLTIPAHSPLLASDRPGRLSQPPLFLCQAGLRSPRSHDRHPGHQERAPG